MLTVAITLVMFSVLILSVGILSFIILIIIMLSVIILSVVASFWSTRVCCQKPDNPEQQFYLIGICGIPQHTWNDSHFERSIWPMLFTLHSWTYLERDSPRSPFLCYELVCIFIKLLTNSKSESRSGFVQHLSPT